MLPFCFKPPMRLTTRQSPLLWYPGVPQSGLDAMAAARKGMEKRFLGPRQAPGPRWGYAWSGTPLILTL